MHVKNDFLMKKLMASEKNPGIRSYRFIHAYEHIVVLTETIKFRGEKLCDQVKRMYRLYSSWQYWVVQVCRALLRSGVSIKAGHRVKADRVAVKKRKPEITCLYRQC